MSSYSALHQTSTASVSTVVQWIYDWGDGTHTTQTFANVMIKRIILQLHINTVCSNTL
jgi:hypothetical protein